MAGTLTPERTAQRLCDLSTDARGAVLLDAAGVPASVHGVSAGHAGELADLARELFEAVDGARVAGGPPQQVEIQVERGAVYASRTPSWTLAVVARRAALSSLMLMDLRAVLGELEDVPIRRATAAATEEGQGFESPVPELGVDDS